MRFQVRTATASRQRAACIVLPAFSRGALPQATRDADRAAKGFIRSVIASGDFSGEAGATLLLPKVPGLACPRVLLVGLGERAKYDRKACRKAMRSAFAAITRTRAGNVVSYLGTELPRNADAYRCARIAIETWYEASYRFLEMKTRDRNKGKVRQTAIGLAATRGNAAEVRRGIAHGLAVGNAVWLARDLGNLPPNRCTPTYLMQQARAVAGRFRRLHVQVLSEPQMRRLGMGSLLSVTAGSRQPARFIILRYRSGRKARSPVVLVGKGITFDTGGISLKPGPQMDEMKYDMSGAGAVLAVMQAVAELGLPIDVVGLMPACENMPGGNATRPGDIVRSMSGQTVEILNTDAEGRLILCDALNYGLRFKPVAMIDIATLTGACVVALGKLRSGLMSNSDDLSKTLLEAGELADDPAWRLPLDEEYMDQLKSPFADVANIGGRDAGTITAAAFLSRFVGETAWAHLDIAGTAWVTSPQKGSTGRPVPLLVEYLLNQ
ncbi:MAG: leucyl aminopeptidase [Gammaproteobacteria bacterium]|nr:MAG: leucyl aminopeptidase [Gammaproteobacteria bacterium]